MAVKTTDFSGYTTGVQPSDWSSQWGGSTIFTVEEDVGAEGGKWLKDATTNFGNKFLRWDEIAATDDIVLLAKVQADDAGATQSANVLVVRGSGGASDPKAYTAELRNDTSKKFRIGRFNGSTSYSVLADTAFAWVANTWYWIKFEAVGTTIRAKIWEDGDPEPGSWTLSTTDANIASGRVGVGDLFQNDVSIRYYDTFTATTANTKPATPTLTVGDVGQTTADLSGSAFSDPDGDGHEASRWQVDVEGGDFSSPVYDSGEDESNLTSITAIGLSPGRSYVARLQYKDDSEQEDGTEYSSWSTEVSFTTNVWSGCASPDVASWSSCGQITDDDPFSGGDEVWFEEENGVWFTYRAFYQDGTLVNHFDVVLTIPEILLVAGGGSGGDGTLTTGGGGAGGVKIATDVDINPDERIPIRIGEGAEVIGGGGRTGEDSVVWVDGSGDALDPDSDPAPSATKADGGGAGGATGNGGDGGSGGGGGQGSGGGSPVTTAGGSGSPPQGNNGGGGASTGCLSTCCKRNGGGGGSYLEAGESGGGIGSTTPGDGGGPTTLAGYGLQLGGGGQGGSSQSEPNPGDCSGAGGEFANAGANGSGFGAGGGGAAGPEAGNTIGETGGEGKKGVVVFKYQGGTAWPSASAPDATIWTVV